MRFRVNMIEMDIVRQCNQDASLVGRVDVFRECRSMIGCPGIKTTLGQVLSSQMGKRSRRRRHGVVVTGKVQNEDILKTATTTYFCFSIQLQLEEPAAADPFPLKKLCFRAGPSPKSPMKNCRIRQRLQRLCQY